MRISLVLAELVTPSTSYRDVWTMQELRGLPLTEEIGQKHMPDAVGAVADRVCMAPHVGVGVACVVENGEHC